jgi:hypothetical protein
LTDRRATLTLTWRPVGTHARRFDDFAEVPYDQPLPTRAPEAPEPDRRDIGIRLENWARMVRPDRERAISPTAAFCDRLKREALGDQSGVDDRRSLDEADAWLLESCMRNLPTPQRRMLWLCYVEMESPDSICRKLSIRHKPASNFTDAFYAAQRAVESAAQQQRGKR